MRIRFISSSTYPAFHIPAGQRDVAALCLQPGSNPYEMRREMEERQGREISLRIERRPIPVSEGLGVGFVTYFWNCPIDSGFWPQWKSRAAFDSVCWWVLGGVRRLTPGLLLISERLTQVVMVELPLAFQLNLSARRDLFYESGLYPIKDSVDWKTLSDTSTFSLWREQKLRIRSQFINFSRTTFFPIFKQISPYLRLPYIPGHSKWIA